MLSKSDLTSQALSSLDALFEEDARVADLPQVQSTAASAMKILMLGNQQSYINEIKKLAALCAQLLKKDSTVDSVVHAIKSGTTASYQQALDKLTSEIGLGQFQLDHSNPQTLAGQNLEKRVKTMRRYKATPLAEIMEAVITDTLVQACARFGADIGDFDFINCKPGLATP
ncbi:Uncharacterised protein [Legionella steigerwaltii]|uniref:Uncharacterized protein n=1 Tax=Legionella steigerwaltii TaxID=460 RepID=A0A378LBW7_9GAMM|nr:hypothetical protein [Legionella steigerwaltii]KTD71654.1 hypothetical protein Lstg_2862 [Legionella steigerwaltii]STY23820.1 Uncharacterised protein [Legionella steigerwaltii]